MGVDAVLEPEDDQILGRVFDDRYMVLRAISRGSMGEVYEGVQLNLSRPVAIKVMHSHVIGANRDEYHKRFLFEAASLARLSNPGTVKVFDFGVYDGRPYLVMEYVEGETLRSLCQHGPLDPLRGVRIAGQLAGALREAHELGLLHRDLKPANVLVTPHADGDICKLIDFGLVKQVNAEEAHGLTQQGVVLGTPMYLAPEIIEGSAPDERADIYALGVLMFRMLVGRDPFSREGGMRALLRRILLDDVPPLETASPDMIVPGALSWIVATCLHKDPEDRFPTMHQVQRALAAAETALTDPHCASMTLSLADGLVRIPEHVPTNTLRLALAPIAVPTRGPPRTAIALALLGVVGVTVGALWFAGTVSSPNLADGLEDRAPVQTISPATATAPPPVREEQVPATILPTYSEVSNVPSIIPDEVIEAGAAAEDEIVQPPAVAEPAPRPAPVRQPTRAKPKPKPKPKPAPAKRPEPALAKPVSAPPAIEPEPVEIPTTDIVDPWK